MNLNPTFSLNLENTKLLPASEPFHVQCPVPGTLSPHIVTYGFVLVI